MVLGRPFDTWFIKPEPDRFHLFRRNLFALVVDLCR